jgi:hypothetical protein
MMQTILLLPTPTKTRRKKVPSSQQKEGEPKKTSREARRESMWYDLI